MPDDYITLQQARAITGHANTAELRRAALRWAAGDKTGLRAEHMHGRLWVTKRTWVERWQQTRRRRGQTRKSQDAGDAPAE